MDAAAAAADAALSTRNIATQQRQPRQPIDHLFPNHKQSIHLLAGAFISVSGKTQKGVLVAQITGTAQRGDYTVTVSFFCLFGCWAAAVIRW